MSLRARNAVDDIVQVALAASTPSVGSGEGHKSGNHRNPNFLKTVGGLGISTDIAVAIHVVVTVPGNRAGHVALRRGDKMGEYPTLH